MQGKLQAAHQASANHADDIDDDTECGCFYCQATFRGRDIEEWIDEPQTALCPRCGIDAVLPAPALPDDMELNEELLREMNAAWY